MTSQRLPLDDKNHAKLVRMGTQSGVDSAEAVVSNIVSSGKPTGYRASESSQKTQKKVDYYKYPSGKEVMTALNGNGVVFALQTAKVLSFKTRIKKTLKGSIQ